MAGGEDPGVKKLRIYLDTSVINFLFNVNKERRVLVTNQTVGYVHPMRITTPLEVMTDE